MRLFDIIGIAIIATITPITVHACSCSEPIDTDSVFSRASSVILAEISDTKLVKTVHKEHDLEYIFANIDIIETFKSDGKSVDKVIDLVPEEGNCSIDLISGLEYVFFIDTRKEEESIEPDNYVGKCTGSHMVNIYHKDFGKKLEELRSLSTPAKTEKTSFELNR